MPNPMTGRERFLAALDRAPVDRVPMFELLIDPHVPAALTPACSYAEFADIMDLDCVVTGTPSLALYGHESITLPDGSVLIRTEWGDMRARTAEVVPIAVEHPVKSHRDWERYQIPDASAPSRFDRLDELVARFKGRRAVGVHLHDAFAYPCNILGMSNLFLLMIDDPGWVREIVDACVEHSVQMVRQAAAHGADFVAFADDYGGKSGPLMSPRAFRQFFLPGLSRVVSTARDLGLAVVKHTDGNVASILDMIVDAGIQGFHPSDPSAGMDIVRTKQVYGDRICVLGGIDTGDPLSHWPVTRLVEEVRGRVRALAPGGGWIIASSNSIHSSVLPPNYAAMVWATRAYGQYAHLDEFMPVPDLEARFGFKHATATLAAP